jgi:hypothetical protein
MANSLHPHYA